MFNDMYLDFVWWEIISSMHLSINLTNSSFTSPGPRFHFMYPFFFPRRWLLPRSYQYYLVLIILNRQEGKWMIPSELICPPPLPFTFMIRWTSAWSMQLENMGQSSISTFGSLHHSACYWHYIIRSASTFSSLRPHAQYVGSQLPISPSKLYVQEPYLNKALSDWWSIRLRWHICCPPLSGICTWITPTVHKYTASLRKEFQLTVQKR